MGKSVESPLEKIESILKSENMGFLGMSKNGTPYVIPVTYGYFEGKILFHCAIKGKKLDYIRTNPQVCFTVGRQFGKTIRHPQGANCHSNHDSVICYGYARIIDNNEERVGILNIFNQCLQPGTKEIKQDEASGCLAVEIRIDKMTARQQRKGIEHAFWEYDFKKRKQKSSWITE